MSKRDELVQLVQTYLGRPGDFFVDKEIEALGFDDLDNLTKTQKKSMITLFLLDVFRPVVNAEGMIAVRHKLCAIFDVKERLIH